MRNPYLIQVAEERNTHMFFEETAEIFSAESNLICYFFERKFLGIMFSRRVSLDWLVPIVTPGSEYTEK